jgi:hypothetical protein
MDNDNVKELLAYHFLIGKYYFIITYIYFRFLVSFLAYLCFLFVSVPLDPNPRTEIDRIVNELRIKYRTYVVEFNVEYVGFRFFIP